MLPQFGLQKVCFASFEQDQGKSRKAKHCQNCVCVLAGGHVYVRVVSIRVLAGAMDAGLGYVLTAMLII